MQETYLTDLQVAARYNVNRATPWRWSKAKDTFPNPIALSKGCSRWKLSELEAWERKKNNAAR